MKDSINQPLLADVRAELDVLGGELRGMILARWELARLEVEADFRSAKRLTIVWVVSAIMGLTAFPLMAVCAADALDGWGHMTRVGWLLIFAGALLILAIAGAHLAWRRFRRRFVGLRETIEELREDMVWLQEGRRTRADAGPTDKSSS